MVTDPHCTAEQAPGDPRIDGFRIERLIGKGSFSRVYEAVQLEIGRRVAVKVLDTPFRSGRDAERFRSECTAMGALSHESIVTVHRTAMTDDGRPCIVMQLFAGSCGAVDRLMVDEVVTVGHRIADALQYAHERSVFHYDVKPDNILISFEGRPALGDFGISLHAGRGAESGGRGGTMAYAPPEFFTGEHATPGSRDVYSLGVTQHRLTAGELPFPEMNVETLPGRNALERFLTRDPPRLPSAAGAGLADLVEQCMAKDPSERPTSAAEVRDRLRELQASVGVADPARLLRFVGARPSPAPREPARRREAARHGRTVVRELPQHVVDGRGRGREADEPPRNRRRAVIAAGATAAVVGISALAIALWPDRDSPDETSQVSQPPPVSTIDFVVLVPPDTVQVSAVDDRSYRVEWHSAQEDVRFQLHLVGTDENRIVGRSPFVWSFDGTESVPDPVCFEIRTVAADEQRMSQASAGPACAG